MRAFDGFDEQEQFSLFLADGGVVAVGERTGRLAAEACQVVLVLAEGLRGGSVEDTLFCRNSGAG